MPVNPTADSRPLTIGMVRMVWGLLALVAAGAWYTGSKLSNIDTRLASLETRIGEITTTTVVSPETRKSHVSGTSGSVAHAKE